MNFSKLINSGTQILKVIINQAEAVPDSPPSLLAGVTPPEFRLALATRGFACSSKPECGAHRMAAAGFSHLQQKDKT
jgi:hypothetical protein